MSDIKALREIEGIRIRRVDDAQDALRRAQATQRQAEQALQEARMALEDYRQRLPGLIEQLYADCIGHLVSREFVQDKAHEETRLRAKVEDHKAKVTETEHQLEKAVQQVKDALLRLSQERVKLEALQELLKAEREKLGVARARAEAKVLDDLAGSKFVRRMAH